MSNVNIGPLLARKYLNAVKQAEVHREELRLINEELPAALLHSWEAMVKLWENDRSAPNPYYTPVMSTHSVFKWDSSDPLL